MNTNMILRLATKSLQQYYKSKEYVKPFKTEEIANIVIAHSAAAAVAAMAGGIVPGVAAIVASGVALASIWSMYYRIGSRLGIGFNLDILKALASALITNLVTQIGGVLALDLVFSFVPGASILVCGIINFAVVYIAGCMYLHMLADLFKAGMDPASLSADDLKKAYSEAGKKVDIKAACDEAKTTFKDMKKSGDLKKKADEAQPME